MIDPKRIWSSAQLPTLPAVAVRLLELARNPESGTREIVNLIKSDPAISAKVLKAANSTFFGLSSKVTSVERAVPLLGTTMVTSLALSFCVVDAAVNKGPLAEHYSRYWLQSIVHAAAAGLLGAPNDSAQSGDYFLTGLLMDIGRLAMLKTIPDAYRPVLDEWNRGDQRLHDLEVRVLGVDHLVVGAELMRNWGLPEALRNAARLHHASVEDLHALSAAPEAPLIYTAAAAGAIGDYFCAHAKGRALERVRGLLAAFHGTSEASLPQLLEDVKARVKAAGDLFAVNTSDLPDPAELMAQASEQLAQLAMREHVAGTQAVARQKVAEQQHRELQAENAQLMQKALHDPLTKVYNRAYFDETLVKEVQRCCRGGNSLGIIFVDVDKFKHINDTYGHPFGDQVLKQVAACMTESVRASDTLARYGGEEFVVLVTEPTEKGLEKIAQRLRINIESADFRFREQRVKVTASFGAALTIPGRNDTAIGPRLIAVADEAMYQAKQSGRNCVRCRVVLKEFDRRMVQLVLQQRFSRWLVSHGILDINTVSKALVGCERQRLRTGDLARKLGLLEPRQVEQVLAEQESNGKRFGETALELGYLTEQELANLLALQQEDPHDLAARLVVAGALGEDHANDLVQKYLAEKSPVLVTG